MDYQDNFQDMIARYNRELMRTYQKAHEPPEPSIPQEQPAQPAPSPPPDESAPTTDTRPLYPLFEADPTAQRRPAVPSIAVWAPVAKMPAEEATETVAKTTAEERGETAPEETVVMEPPADPAPEETVVMEPPANPTPEETVVVEPPADPAPEETVVVEPPADPTPTSPETPSPTPAPSATTSEPAPSPMEVGYLQVWVTTARDAFPIEGAHVTVSGDGDEGRELYFIGLTDSSGKTAQFPLPAANSQLSLVPGDGTITYTPYNIEVYADGYYRTENIGLPMYGGVKAMLPVQLIPLPENGKASDTLVFSDSGPTGLSGGEVNNA